jgi:hypothetical protein
MTTATRPATHTSAEVCHQTGISWRQLDTWCRRGYLRAEQYTPFTRMAEGSGYPRHFPKAELDVARTMARLVLLGVTAQQAAWVARDPQQRWRWLADVNVTVVP